MPTFTIPIGGIVRAITYCTVPGQVSTNTRKYQLVSLSSGTTFPSGDFVLAYDADMVNLYPPLLSTGAQYYGVQAYLMNPIGLPPRPDHVNINATAGTFGAGLLPTQSSGLISLYSSTLGKIGQGRIYVPFGSPTALDANGTPTAAYGLGLTDLGAYSAANRVIIAGGITATFRPCLYQGGVDTPRFIETFKIHDAFATQRRRGSFGRANSLPF